MWITCEIPSVILVVPLELHLPGVPRRELGCDFERFTQVFSQFIQSQVVKFFLKGHGLTKPNVACKWGIIGYNGAFSRFRVFVDALAELF